MGCKRGKLKGYDMIYYRGVREGRESRRRRVRQLLNSITVNEKGREGKRVGGKRQCPSVVRDALPLPW